MATHTFPALDTNNVFTGTETFTGVSAMNNIQYVDGVINTTVQAAINALPGTGGTVYVPPGTYIGPTTIPSNTAIVAFAGQSDQNIAGSFAITYGSPHTAITFTYSASLNLTNVQNLYIKGITFDFANTGGFSLTSCSFCVFEHLSLLRAGIGSGAALQLTTSGNGGANNSIENLFRDLSISCNQSGIPTVTGILIGAGAASTAAVTLNSFDRITITGNTNIGIDIEKEADTNYFTDITINNDSGTAGTAGLAFNTSNSSSDIDSDACVFTNISTTGAFNYFIAAGQSTGNIITGAAAEATSFCHVLGGTPNFTITNVGFVGQTANVSVGGILAATATPGTILNATGSVAGDVCAIRSSTSGVLFLGQDGSQIFKTGSPAVFSLSGAGGTVPASLILGGATPTAGASSIGLGGTVGFGAGSTGTAVTTTTKGAGSGPTTPQTVVNYLQVNIAGTTYWLPLVQ